MKFIKLAIAIAAGTFGLLFTAGTAWAVPAEARIAVNVRTGPAISYMRVDTLTPREAVDVLECEAGWCYVDQDGPNGWVSATYLQAPSSGPAAPADPNCTFEFSIGPGGPNLSLVCEDPTPAPPPPPPPGVSQACVYTGANYSGNEFCMGPATLNSLGGTFNNNISSVRLSGNAKIRLCVDPNLSGFCRDIVTSENALGGFLDDQTSSLRVFTGPAAPPPPPPPTDQACFYTGSNYSGNEYCVGPTTRNSIGAAFDNNITSVRLFGNAKAYVCVDQNFAGFCRNIVSSDPGLGGFLDNQISSLRVFTGPVTPPPPPPPATPETYSSGFLSLQQTFAGNLDNGTVGGSGTDIWYQAENAVSKFLTPQNGAQLALGDGSNRGFAGCSAASFSSSRISIWTMPVGSYVCARTSAGRISQFRLNGYSGTTMNLGYTTWR